MGKKILFVLCILSFGFFDPAKYDVGENKPGKKSIDPEKLDLFLLIGQSNMAGRAKIEAQDGNTLMNVFLFTGDPGNEWEHAANPLNIYSTVRKELSMQKSGPGYTFAQEIARNIPEKNIGLIVNARGGTSIAEWMPGCELYKEAVQRTKMASEYGRLRGVIWHQGESDIRIDSYLQRLEILIFAMREDLGIPDLPFVAGQLSFDKPERADFNRMIKHLPKKVASTEVVSAKGLSTFDGTHFDPDSQRTLGKRYAEKMLKLLRRQPD